jgi:23S rRNA (cytosine1962-C5)-methyltransferase
MNKQAVLHEDRIRTVYRRHPWVYSRAIRRFSGAPQAGDIVTLVSEEGKFLARGMWNEQSSIRLRVITWEDEAITPAFWEGRLKQALALRGPIPPGQARRLVNAENDYLPGLIVDQYGEWLVLQALTAGIEREKTLLAEILQGLTGARGVYERSDSDARSREGLGLAEGPLWGEAPPDLIEIQENGRAFAVDIRIGHKTGFYLDQRENRRLLADFIPAGARVLNTFCYTGGFSVYAQAAGAGEVLSVDSSAEALNLAAQNLEKNGGTAEGLIQADVFQQLRHYQKNKERFDVIVLDPPKFAKKAEQLAQAIRGYQDINRLAWELLRPGGLLMTYSCSGAMTADLFRKVVFGTLEDVGRDAQVLQQLSAPSDHPVALTFPEGEYLKGLLCRAL